MTSNQNIAFVPECLRNSIIDAYRRRERVFVRELRKLKSEFGAFEQFGSVYVPAEAVLTPANTGFPLLPGHPLSGSVIIFGKRNVQERAGDPLYWKLESSETSLLSAATAIDDATESAKSEIAKIAVGSGLKSYEIPFSSMSNEARELERKSST